MSPYWLAEYVAASCRVELDLPLETHVRFCDLGETWGEFDPATPKVLKVTDRLLEPAYRHLIPRAVAHEALHCSVYHRTRAGTVAARYTLDHDLQEQSAVDYADHMAERWRTILWTQP